MLASTAQRPAAEQVAALLGHWRAMRKGDVIARVVGPASAVALARLAGELLELPRMRLASLLDPAPLGPSLERWVDWPALHRNVRSGTLPAICVVATSLERGGPVAFVERRGDPPASDRDIAYVHARLSGEHVRASAAIPLLFPPVAVRRPRAAAGHYIDGGTRLNAPIAPALALGARRIAVIGFEPLGGAGRAARRSGPPRLAEVGANVLDGLLVDPVAEDVHRMTAINSFFAEDAARGPAPGAHAYRAARGREPYRRIAFALVSPRRRGRLGELAEAVFRRRFGGLRGLRSPDFVVLARLLGGGQARARGELLSFLLFDPEFVEALIAEGRRDARRWLREHPGVWTTDPARAGFAAPGARRVAEMAALDEYRGLRRG
jgi:NTE family protein